MLIYSYTNKAFEYYRESVWLESISVGYYLSFVCGLLDESGFPNRLKNILKSNAVLKQSYLITANTPTLLYVKEQNGES